MRKFVVGVMGPGEAASEDDLSNARRLGELIARQGWVLLTGGRDAGVMRAANAGAKRVPGSLTVGILPGDSHGAAAPDVDVVIVTDMGNARNNINVLSSDVVVACGVGGAGTVSEVALAIKAGRPVILLSAGELAASFFKSLGGDGFRLAASPDEVVDLIKAGRPG